jgi:uncharacterized protein YndB with AHSA1/START domain
MSTAMIVVLVVVGIVVLLAVTIATRPSEFRITRSATISAPPAEVFARVNDFHRWQEWSPWAKRDPNAKNSYEGSASGPGAIFRWSGNSQVGEGGMTILESRPNELILIKLEFLKPFKATNSAEFTFKPAGRDTAVTWSMSGRHNPMMKAFGLFMNLDKMVGGDFEKGLANLNAVVTSVPHLRSGTIAPCIPMPSAFNKR